MVYCSKYEAAPQDSAGSSASTLSNAEALYNKLSNDSGDHAIVAPNLISKYEMNFYYHGISGDPPKLLWRSDLETNPFPIPPPGARFFKIPEKTIHGVFNTPLNAVWSTVAPQILASMRAQGLKCSSLKTARFSNVMDGGQETLGPVVVLIAVRPGTTNAMAVRDATPAILQILADAKITDVAVEWYEAEVVRLVDNVD